MEKKRRRKNIRGVNFRNTQAKREIKKSGEKIQKRKKENLATSFSSSLLSQSQLRTIVLFSLFTTNTSTNIDHDSFSLHHIFISLPDHKTSLLLTITLEIIATTLTKIALISLIIIKHSMVATLWHSITMIITNKEKTDK